MDRLGNESGFTLTELLISVIIIAIGVVGFATAVGVQSTELWIGQRDTRLSMTITDKVEEIKALPYYDVLSGSEVVEEHTLTWTVQAGNPKRVVLEATYEGSGGDQLADTVVFYVPR
ncbi:MAG: prepilin-type N-terminal cleavage/methylation domain-containing protein [Gemmatimonadetes bacterium]|uniref:Prepilin-type N-terminal cleavage/methylation domain-containing protein n=1 Tax=Candidatus Kutchimonas denitrificans TaxID=3056748 RepID=A0AAE4Z5K0_9BACT|nr:prepilin-type N-terminal cleavage/methylation domain-containing protein [Gemmatimonadota bacterium]NIR74184.1 prepilin-type N-terminal cleavage/methylation domain-containing protein [Candidatus Kutchimonas denitrificans]NIR99806.1 prepilin-type N-terminal cleavage/methylation domain-containing protein [Gemmatimonadota bacterium]NIT65395.1 prepilin-type N-terminal cleavage/methylation domain-containing protein [Gemmatimonadota bacterium]NIU51761.1 prepilin-type N-terminal cleavage/methylation